MWALISSPPTDVIQTGKDLRWGLSFDKMFNISSENLTILQSLKVWEMQDRDFNSRTVQDKS